VAFSWRVRIPGNIGLDRVQAHLAGLPDAVGPRVTGMDTEIVKCAREDAKGLAVQQEVVVADGELRPARAAVRGPCIVGGRSQGCLPSPGPGAAVILVSFRLREPVAGPISLGRPPGFGLWVQGYLLVTLNPCWVPYVAEAFCQARRPALRLTFLV